MKSILLCIISNKSEAKIVFCTKDLMKHRIGNCDVESVLVDQNSAQFDMRKKCLEMYKVGYRRIYIQIVSLAFSDEAQKKFQNQINDICQLEPEINVTYFPLSGFQNILADTIERNVYNASLADMAFEPTPPDEIQVRSFDFISKRLGDKYPDPDVKSVVVRVIHAVGDFSVEPLLRFFPDAVACGKAALKANCSIITDVGMVSAGLATRFRNRTICAINYPGVHEYASDRGLTRSAAAIELLAEKIDGAIVAIGNAPTALVHLLSVIKKNGVKPSCIVGVPVGFVGAAESKELLMSSGLPYISLKGNRGGSPIAVAIVNAMGCL